MATRMSSREFNQDTSGAKKAAERGPVYITDRGRLAYVLLTFDAYNSCSANIGCSTCSQNRRASKTSSSVLPASPKMVTPAALTDVRARHERRLASSARCGRKGTSQRCGVGGRHSFGSDVPVVDHGPRARARRPARLPDGVLRRIPAADPVGAAKRNAIAALIAFVDVPIVHFSVEWWRTLHQKATVFSPNSTPRSTA